MVAMFVLRVEASRCLLVDAADLEVLAEQGTGAELREPIGRSCEWRNQSIKSLFLVIGQLEVLTMYELWRQTGGAREMMERRWWVDMHAFVSY
jgi:hypothetical protein